MIVEDEIVTAMGIGSLLSDMNYEPLKIVSSGEEAIKQVELSNPDLLLMDITLDGKMDGIDTANEIQKKHDIPIIFITAHEDIETLQKAKNVEPSSYIIKPIQTVNDLLPAIELAFHNFNIKQKLKMSDDKLKLIQDLIASDELKEGKHKNKENLKVRTSHISTKIHNEKDFQTLVGKLEVLGNMDRFLILEVLRTHQLKLSDIQKLIKKSQSTSSHHIKKLESEGLIKGWKKGKFTYYSIDKEKVQNFLDLWNAWIERKDIKKKGEH
ncbi:metalloregulator ArsR/SmtB family transcription factor [Candidatus Lokiarchaeum ossiferum]